MILLAFPVFSSDAGRAAAIVARLLDRVRLAYPGERVEAVEATDARADELGGWTTVVSLMAAPGSIGELGRMAEVRVARSEPELASDDEAFAALVSTLVAAETLRERLLVSAAFPADEVTELDGAGDRSEALFVALVDGASERTDAESVERVALGLEVPERLARYNAQFIRASTVGGISAAVADLMGGVLAEGSVVHVDDADKDPATLGVRRFTYARFADRSGQVLLEVADAAIVVLLAEAAAEVGVLETMRRDLETGRRRLAALEARAGLADAVRAGVGQLRSAEAAVRRRRAMDGLTEVRIGSATAAGAGSPEVRMWPVG